MFHLAGDRLDGRKTTEGKTRNLDERIRPAQPDDIEAVTALIHELALYEKLPEECHVTPQMLHEALFAENPAVYCHVGIIGGRIAGFALHFLNFSTWEGVHGIYLEDLYVQPEYRGSGLGKALLLNLAEIANERGYARVEWSVLDWNTPSIDFYRSLGAVPMDGWTQYRLTGDALRAHRA